MFPERIETDSLVLERLCEAIVDVFELYHLFAASREDVTEVFEYVPQEPYATPNDAHERIEKAERRWDDREHAQYGVSTADGDLAGYAGLFLEWDRRTGRLGVTLGKPYWGRGYAVECATALTDLAFDRLDLELVAIGHEEGNDRSKRAIEKYVDRVGGKFEGTLRNWTPVGDEVLAHHRYTVTREEYREATGDR